MWEWNYQLKYGVIDDRSLIHRVWNTSALSMHVHLHKSHYCGDGFGESSARTTGYSALPIYHGLFSPNNSPKIPIGRPLRRAMVVSRDFLVWPRFYLLIYCAVCNIVLYHTAIYLESVVLGLPIASCIIIGIIIHVIIIMILIIIELALDIILPLLLPLSLIVIQWNLSVTTTSIIKFLACDLFSNVF